MTVGGLLNRWRWLRRSTRANTPTLRSRVRSGYEPPTIYAIGDVHGCLALLKRLEAQIIDDARTVEGEKWIVMLGDYVDRGPLSAQVLDHLVAPPPPGFRRYCLAGNHELAMRAFLEAPSTHHRWLEIGGWETIRSYGISNDRPASVDSRRLAALVHSHIPREHELFLEHLPVALETPRYLFVHAGLVPGRPLALQTDHDLVWFRDNLRESYEELGKIVVHGHQPNIDVHTGKYRICVDTGAYVTGKLSAVRLSEAEPVQIFEVTAAEITHGRREQLPHPAIEGAPN